METPFPPFLKTAINLFISIDKIDTIVSYSVKFQICSEDHLFHFYCDIADVQHCVSLGVQRNDLACIRHVSLVTIHHLT